MLIDCKTYSNKFYSSYGNVTIKYCRIMSEMLLDSFADKQIINGITNFLLRITGLVNISDFFC